MGHAGTLQFHIPLKGRLLFGEMQGLAQFGLRWQEEAALLDGRVYLNLPNFQAAGAGLSVGGTHIPLIEDQWDGQVAFRTDGFRLDQQLFDLLGQRWDEIRQLDRVNLEIAIQRSKPVFSFPGVVQISTDFELQLLNPILNQIVRNLRLSGPPAAILYQDLHFNFNVSDGRISCANPLLDLQGLRFYSSDKLELDGNLRVHWGWQKNASVEESLTLRDLAAFARRNLNAQMVRFPLHRVENTMNRALTDETPPGVMQAGYIHENAP